MKVKPCPLIIESTLPPTNTKSSEILYYDFSCSMQTKNNEVITPPIVKRNFFHWFQINKCSKLMFVRYPR